MGGTQAEDPALEAKAREMCAADGHEPDEPVQVGFATLPRWRAYKMMAAKALQAARRAG